MTLDAENGMVKGPAAGSDLKAHESKRVFILRVYEWIYTISVFHVAAELAETILFAEHADNVKASSLQ